MTAFSPGASPPPVLIAIFLMASEDVLSNLTGFIINVLISDSTSCIAIPSHLAGH
jgi:hypothetical protein